ncbi:MAG: AarF/UbiB family protein [Caldilineaceae bacterium]
MSKQRRQRYREIAEIMARHGFGALVAHWGLERYFELPQKWWSGQQTAHNGHTPAEHLRLALEELGPTFIKVGQLLSTRPDLLPPRYIAELKQLQDNVPPAPWAKIEPLIETELGRPVLDCFAAFETTPMAAASLGQVYVATLPTGEEVVAKVQRPGIEPVIETDLEIFMDVAQYAQNQRAGELYNLTDIAEEFAAIIRHELDYVREARHAERLQANSPRANISFAIVCGCLPTLFCCCKRSL